MGNVVFAIAAVIALVSAVLMVTRRNPIYSAVWLLVTFVCVAIQFLTLGAPFLAAVHVLVYTGAILVLFLFVIMLLNLREDELGDEYPLSVRLSVAAMCAVLFALMASAILREPALAIALPEMSETYGSVEQVGNLMFKTYGLQFEIVSVLIIVAMFGAVVLAKKKVT